MSFILRQIREFWRGATLGESFEPDQTILEAAKANPPEVEVLGMQCPRRSESWVGSSPTFQHADDTGEDGKCTFCGSMSPEQLFKAIEQGVELTPTDKNYKVYVGGSGKFYFQHLSKDEQITFVKLLNEKKIKIGLPGHFYVLPFFITR